MRSLFCKCFVGGLVVVFTACHPSGEERLAPDFTLPVLNSTEVNSANVSVRLSQLTQKGPVLLVFWATWCPACHEEVPVLNEWQEKWGPKGLQIYAINVEESAEDVQFFVSKYQVKYPVLLDSEGEVTALYGVAALPSAVLLAKGGEILYYGFSLPPNIQQIL